MTRVLKDNIADKKESGGKKMKQFGNNVQTRDKEEYSIAIEGNLGKNHVTPRGLMADRIN